MRRAPVDQHAANERHSLTLARVFSTDDADAADECVVVGRDPDD
ncbi:hypothetical protein [Haloprofundus halobius]|nr:hypothetical protein [Haloprofundus halobius]